MAFDTSLHTELDDDYRDMDDKLHEMVEGVHEFEDRISEELKEAEEMEQLLSKVMKEVEDLRQKNLAIEKLEEKAEQNGYRSAENLDQEEKEIVEDMFAELHQLAKDIDTARAVIADLKDKDDGAREDITKLAEIDRALEEGQNQLMGDEKGMLKRLEKIHADHNAEVNHDWITKFRGMKYDE